jgi:hypothetical protein
MGIREVLQTEIWSTETSRKIFRAVMRTVTAVGLLLVFVVVWYVVSNAWLTRSERRTAQVALSEIDALQYLDRLRDDEYAIQYKQADANVHIAEQAAWTRRDKLIAMLLSNYLMYTDIRRSDYSTRLKLSNSSDYRSRKYEQLASQNVESSISTSAIQSLMLHDALK